MFIVIIIIHDTVHGNKELLLLLCQKISKASEDLANVRGELASVSAKYSNSKTQIHHLKTTLSEKDTDNSHLKVIITRN